MTKPTFGRRGLSQTKQASFAASLPEQRSLPPDLVAAILQPAGQEAAGERSRVTKVGWSFRGAVLAGLIVGFLNAAVHATGVLDVGDGLVQNVLGDAKVPVAVLLAAAGLWGGARASAFVLLFAHALLDRLGRTGYLAYALAGAAASGGYSLIAAAFGAQHSLVLDPASGAAAGFFYRLFATSERG